MTLIKQQFEINSMAKINDIFLNCVNDRSTFSLFLVSRSVDVLNLKVTISFKEQRHYVSQYLNHMIHQINCNTLTNVLKRAAYTRLDLMLHFQPVFTF